MVTSLKIDEELKGRIRTLAAARDRSAHWIMREAIKEYVQREEDRERFKREAVDAWVAYCENGRHLTGQEAVAWIGGWGTALETDLPDCHD